MMLQDAKGTRRRTKRRIPNANINNQTNQKHQLGLAFQS